MAFPSNGMSEISKEISRMNASLMEKQQRAANPVIDVFESLRGYVEEFQADLDDLHEVGARLVSFGNTVTFHVRQIGYSAPSVIWFDGITDDGNRVKLVQHVSQLSFLLVAMPVKPNQVKHPIGFIG